MQNWLTDFFTSATLFWWLLGAATAIFIIHAVIVMYHWFNFGTERSAPIIASVIYVGIGSLLLLSMFGTLLLIS